MRIVASLFVLLLAPAAFAGPCDPLVAKAATAKGADLTKAWTDLVACDPKAAEPAFDAFMKASGDVGTLVDISLAAIDAKLYTPVWNMMEKIPDYSARDEIAKGVGAACSAHDQVVPFVQGAYFGLRDIQFGQWDDALVTCELPAMDTFVEGLVAKPPATSYNEKYAVIVTAYAKKKRADSLPLLEKAAIDSAANGGPFALILEKMDLAIQSADEMGGAPAPADQAKLTASLVRIGNGVGPDQAAQVADKLYNAGAKAEAASLLPRIYPGKVQGGKLMYGVALIEVCDKEAYVHYAPVTDPAKRWSIEGDVDPLARAQFKPKLKCAPADPWPLSVSAPVAASTELATWADGLGKSYAAKGIDVKLKDEKEIDLP
jgi:hypothetical protein